MRLEGNRIIPRRASEEEADCAILKQLAVLDKRMKRAAGTRVHAACGHAEGLPAG